MKWKISFAILLLFFILRSVSALQPPTKEQIEEYRQEGTLAVRMADAEALGNHLVSPNFVARAQYKLKRISLQMDGETDLIFYQVSTGAWYLLPSSGAAPYGVGWGGDLTDLPVTTNLLSNC